MIDPLLAFDDAGLLLLSDLTRQVEARLREGCDCHQAGRLDRRCRLYCRARVRQDHDRDNVPKREKSP